MASPESETSGSASPSSADESQTPALASAEASAVELDEDDVALDEENRTVLETIDVEAVDTAIDVEREALPDAVTDDVPMEMPPQPPTPAMSTQGRATRRRLRFTTDPPSSRDSNSRYQVRPRAAISIGCAYVFATKPLRATLAPRACRDDSIRSPMLAAGGALFWTQSSPAGGATRGADAEPLSNVE